MVGSIKTNGGRLPLHDRFRFHSISLRPLPHSIVHRSESRFISIFLWFVLNMSFRIFLVHDPMAFSKSRLGFYPGCFFEIPIGAA